MSMIRRPRGCRFTEQVDARAKVISACSTSNTYGVVATMHGTLWI